MGNLAVSLDSRIDIKQFWEKDHKNSTTIQPEEDYPDVLREKNEVDRTRDLKDLVTIVIDRCEDENTSHVKDLVTQIHHLWPDVRVIVATNEISLKEKVWN